MNVSIIIPLHKPKKDLLDKIKKSINSQKFKGKIELIEVNHGGLAESLNWGIKKAKNDIVVSLHQDCIPDSKYWLKNLVAPFNNKKIVATVSTVHDIENNVKYTPFLDEKGCAYRKKALEVFGLFDEKTFLNSGEDMDIFLKLKKIGKIAYPKNAIVKHEHKGYLIKKAKYKKLQNANTLGCLFRIYKFKLPSWWKGILLANPLNPKYFYWFYRGFIKKRQDYKK